MIAALYLSLSSIISPVQAVENKQENPQSTKWLYGHWTGSGQLFGKAVQMTLNICPIAKDRGFALSYNVLTPMEEAGKDGNSVIFSGHADYLPVAGSKWRGRWIGSNGIDHDLEATFTKEHFAVIWQNLKVETGQTNYKLLPDGKLSVTDQVIGKSGEWRVFAVGSYKRNGDCS